MTVVKTAIVPVVNFQEPNPRKQKKEERENRRETQRKKKNCRDANHLVKTIKSLQNRSQMKHNHWLNKVHFSEIGISLFLNREIWKSTMATRGGGAARLEACHLSSARRTNPRNDRKCSQQIKWRMCGSFLIDPVVVSVSLSLCVCVCVCVCVGKTWETSRTS